VRIINEKTIDYFCLLAVAFLSGVMLWFHGWLFPHRSEAAGRGAENGAVIYFSDGSASWTPSREHVFREPKRIRVTAYTEGVAGTTGRTSTGSRARYGIAAYDPQYYGWTAILYTVADDGRIGGLLGFFDIEDTGSEPIGAGLNIDVYQETYADCVEWMRKTHTGEGPSGSEVYIQLVEADG
jgi:3D (Asp-Asp-Asp) domain-containing protein